MLDFIFKISSRPSVVKWAFLVTNSTALLQSLKSWDLEPTKQYLLKKGTIISLIKDNLVTTKLEAEPVFSNLPQLKNPINFFINNKSLSCWVTWKPKTVRSA